MSYWQALLLLASLLTIESSCLVLNHIFFYYYVLKTNRDLDTSHNMMPGGAWQTACRHC